MTTEKHAPDSEKIRSMFSKVAKNYDLTNSVLSGGIHHLWRKKLVKLSNINSTSKVLDCATGTGDLAIEFKKRIGPNGVVIGTDFCEEMMRPAAVKVRNLNYDIKFQLADVTNLQFEDNNFDVTSISFGIRNVADPLKAIDEMARVTKSGGQVMVLEFGQSTLPGFSQLYNFYSKNVLPVVGGIVTGHKEAYEYLQKSSAHFPCREDFVSLMQKTNRFSDCRFVSLTGGVAYIYTGIRK